MTCHLPKLLKGVSICLLSILPFAALAAEPIFSSPAFLTVDPSGKRIYIADETASQIIELNVEEKKILQKIPLPSRPTGLALSKAGDRLYVTSHSAEGDVFVIDLDAGRIVTTLKAGHTTMAPVLSADESILYVCDRFNDDVSVIDLKSRREVARLKVVREPMAAALTSDGGILAVANHRSDDAATRPDVAGAVSLIDTQTRKLLANIRLHNGSVGVRGICISPDDRYAFVSHILARNHVPATHLDNGWLNTSGISVIDLVERKLFGSVILDDVGRGAANPWGIACTRDGEKLCVALAGTHEAVVIELPDMLKKLGEFNRTYSADQQPQNGKFDYVGKPYTSLTFLDGLKKRIQLRGKGPRHILVSGKKFYAGMYFSGALESLDLDDLEAGTRRIALGPDQPLTEVRRGEILFNDASISFQGWQSCATCHPEGRSDGLNWDLTNDGIGNTKNAKSLLFADKTPPVTMTGILPSLDACVPFELKTILFSAVGGRDAAAIGSYLKSLSPVPSPHLEDGRLSASALRGKEVFRKAGCAGCHKGEYFTTMKLKNIGTSVFGDQRKAFDIPGLREVWRTAPYLHDGRATTVKEVITKFNPHNKHGRTLKLSERQIADLVHFVLSL